MEKKTDGNEEIVMIAISSLLVQPCFFNIIGVVSPENTAGRITGLGGPVTTGM